MIEIKAKRTAVWVGPKGQHEVVLAKGKLYDWPTKKENGDPDEYSLNIVRSLLAADLVELVDTRPIDKAYVR